MVLLQFLFRSVALKEFGHFYFFAEQWQPWQLRKGDVGLLFCI